MRFVRCGSLDDRIDKRALVVQYKTQPTSEQYSQDLMRMSQRILDYFEENDLEYAGNNDSAFIPLPQLDQSMGIQVTVSFDVRPKPKPKPKPQLKKKSPQDICKT